VFPLFCSPALRDAGRRVAAWLGGFGVRAAPATEQAWRSYSSLADGDARRAFFRTLQSVIDPGGQCVSATDRLYLASHVPTMIVWGRNDRLIPVSHAFAAHGAIEGSRLEIFDGVGHFPHCEAPERFVDVLLDFIDTSTPAELPPGLRTLLLRAGNPRAERSGPSRRSPRARPSSAH
jgi:pimeloyl-ACP methyl ester carboxylesterase